MDPTHPPGFTPVHGQTSVPLPGVMEGSMPSIPPFIPNIPAQGFPVVGTPPLVAFDLGVNRSETERQYDVLEERLKAIEGSNTFDSVDPNDLCLVPKVTLPPKFKVPDFEKFNGTNCPRTHLRLYCQKMAAHSDNERLMMHCFQDSLTGAAIRWYIQQDRTRIRTWKDLANSFIAQYRHVIEMAPDRMTLQSMQMKPTETFREYAYRWRDMSVQVNPPVEDREAISLFVNTSKEGRSVKKCVTFRMFLQKMVDNKFIEIGCTRKSGEIAVIGENRPVYHQCTNQPFIPTMNKALPTQEAPARLVISTPRPFPYKNSSKTNRQNAGEPDRAVKSPISNGEAEEFLKIIKHSEYNIVDQLKKMPAHISVLSLLLNSETHREALLKVLNQAYIPQDISVDKFNHVIGSLAASNYITFTDEEIPPEGQGHNKALHISTKCKDHMMSRVLIDNGSSFNVMPMTTLQRLPIDPSYVTPNNLVVRAFDGTRRESVGSLDIPIQIGPVTFNITFQVMDITPSYSCLLGRPWIHNTGAVPSSLHQRVKFIVGDKLVCVYGETDIMVTKPSSTPYVEAAEEAHEDSFRAFEIINVITIMEGSFIPQPRISSSTHMVAAEMIKSRFCPGKGLGKYLQGIAMPLLPEGMNERYGIGYTPTLADHKKKAEEKRIIRIERRTGRVSTKWGVEVPPMNQTFRKGNQVTLEEEMKQMSILALESGDHMNDSSRWIYPLTGAEIQNWTSFDYPIHFMDRENNHTSIQEPEIDVNFENLILEAEIEEETDLSPEMQRMLKSDEKPTLTSSDPTVTINLGTNEEPKEVKIGALLGGKERCEMINLLKEYQDVFAWSYQDMPGLDTDLVTHKIPIYPDSKPVKQKLRRMRPDMLIKIKEEVQKQFEAGFLEVAKYPEWMANVVPIMKKNGKVRVCVDYRDLNKASPKDNFPLPHIDVLVDNTAGHALFSFMDGFSGYNQIKMAPEDKDKTTFITLWGTFCYKVMPFGLKNAGATYQRAMVTLFHDLMHKEIEVYVDDMIVKSRDEYSYVMNLRKLFKRLRKCQLKLNPEKCTFGASSGKLLGFIISEKGIEVDPDKIKAIREMPSPKTEKEVRSFLGQLNYIARFISQLTATCEPIFKLLKKDNPEKWSEECQKAFEKIKEYLLNPPVLVPPVPGRPLILYLVVSENSMGCVLGQHDESGRKERAIYYLSKKFTEYESRYSNLEKTCCALVWVVSRLRQYTLYYTTWLISKMDPIKYVFEKPAVTGRMARWQMLLTEYDITYVTRKAVKRSIIAEYLADRAVNDYQSMEFDFPDQDIDSIDQEKEGNVGWMMLFDGATNVWGHGIGAVLISPEGKYYPVTAKLTFPCTNNIAEYEACVLGLQAAIDRGIKKLIVKGDSALVIYQLTGKWETRDSKLIPYQEFIQEMMQEFDTISFSHLPRESNLIPDALATLAALFKVESGIEIEPIRIRMHREPAYCIMTEEADGKPWFHDIKTYIQWKEYPIGASNNDRKTIRRLAMGFFLDVEILYKRNHDLTLLRCVELQEARQIIQEVHDGVCGTHVGGHSLARKILRSGYYWITMERDCIEYVRKCHKCQIYGDRIQVPPTQLQVLSAPWPFSAWGMDVIGPITPKASNGHRFIFLAIDYFTKWVEAASYSNVTQNVINRFIRRELICRYGIPERIISDNAKNLNNEVMTKLCSQFKVKHHNSAPYRPQMNGAVEAANKNIKSILEKMTKTYRDWHEKLPFALLAYRTTVRTSTGATPFSLVYGMEAVIPIEVEIPSLRVLKEAELTEAEWVQSRYDQLNLIEEKRLTAIVHGQLYQRRMMRAFNKKVRIRRFQEGDLVLKKILPIHNDPRGKWTPNYEGPYVVKKAFSGGALLLSDMDGADLVHPTNSDAVKKYFS
ncbi:uncharacterized protein LOC131163438 [Malania oleifera]|uniref:uncharacterized protein LOC131163438 n=1 Tax=Malania oleifera TaxID=397392 RepID=UPI0025AE7FE9|nr:uncharacterized protein LOC131163438 [Malania oleifera]